jgi:DNA replication protein DnaC
MSMNVDMILDNLSESVPKSESEYIGEDGFLHCSICHKRTERMACIPSLGINRKVRCICDCKKKEQQAFSDREKKEECERKRSVCFAESNMWKWTFENDDRKNPKLSDAMQNYVKNFTQFKKEGKGLLLYGTVGTGKTYYSACIANALIDEEVSVYMTNFTKILNILLDKNTDKQKYLDTLNRYTLLIIDDLGAERSTPFAREQVFNVIDSRYRSGLPLIVTTNLTADELKKPQAVEYSRIYDRILERCHPVKVEGVSRRRESLKDNFADTQKLLGL